MHQFPSPFPPLNTTTTHSQRHPASDTSSPPSSRTTSPPSSPTSTLRRRHQPTQLSPHHLFNLSFHPTTTTTHPKVYSDIGSRPDNEHHVHFHNHTQGHGLGHNIHNASTQCGVSILPCAVLRGRSSLMIVRRRPSAVDMALSEERCRCDENAIERQGLDLMEPRPVDMNLHSNLNMHMGLNMGLGQRNSGSRASIGSDTRSVVVQQPRFVMGGIFEVMEGQA
ncbi:uncharacterized protein N7473_010677 [Penicillium subrubescens]|uniref:Uncharacterized protein n=1 Tax=Penicillium subrubescens TaxID=1316194 RepID=A0A1Q5T399_9EURO|nr:uncharacterized protein N7473_010677 [Penicillium subrubescens]KAJ5883791.1 hypothetical protein N7473_010677 [Penicillium subrubescens]OKO94605.1 hypothetical protein PENSUB_11872 [Penicillium subrubescens]